MKALNTSPLKIVEGGGGGLRLAGFFGKLTGFVNVQLLFTRAF